MFYEQTVPIGEATPRKLSASSLSKIRHKVVRKLVNYRLSSFIQMCTAERKWPAGLSETFPPWKINVSFSFFFEC
jgi:hypothetical protein